MIYNLKIYFGQYLRLQWWEAISRELGAEIIFVIDAQYERMWHASAQTMSRRD